MGFLKAWNRLFFTPSYSIFEILCFVIIANLAGQYSWWYYLLLVPLFFASALLQRQFGD